MTQICSTPLPGTGTTCPWEATMAVKSARTKSRGIRTTVYYDLEDAPKGADKLCRLHGHKLMVNLIETLVPVECTPTAG